MQNNSPVSPLLVPRVLWAALVFSTFMYFLVLQTSTSTLPKGENPELFQALSIVAGVVLLIAIILPNLIFRAAVARATQPLDYRKAVTLNFVPLVLRLALGEAICILGLTLAFQTKVEDYYPFWFLGLAVMLSSFPTEQGIMRAVERYKKL